jgi:hypothetical protein
MQKRIAHPTVSSKEKVLTRRSLLEYTPSAEVVDPTSATLLLT